MMEKRSDIDLGEDEADLFASGTALPVQFYALPSGCRQPERTLLRAVLGNAVDCFRAHLLSPDRRRQRLYREAEEWLLSTDTSYTFAFESICDTLGLDADYLRNQLCAWRERRIAQARMRASVAPPGSLYEAQPRARARAGAKGWGRGAR